MDEPAHSAGGDMQADVVTSLIWQRGELGSLTQRRTGGAVHAESEVNIIAVKQRLQNKWT